MYVTAGLGPSAHNEGFTHDFDLPNQTAYAETCASVALIFWAQRMLHLDLDGKYADMLELALFNGALSRPQPRRRALFLRQPARKRRHADALGLAHLPVLHDECQPAGRLGRRLFRLDGARWHRLPPLWRHLHRGRDRRHQGRAARDLDLSVVWRHQDRCRSGERRRRSTSSCAFRAGATGAKVSVNGEAVDVGKAVNGYLTINRTWAKGDVVSLDLPMPAERLYAHPGVIMDAGRVALKRGPLVYCVEEIDNPGGRVQRLKLPRNSELRAGRARTCSTAS